MDVALNAILLVIEWLLREQKSRPLRPSLSAQHSLSNLNPDCCFSSQWRSVENENWSLWFATGVARRIARTARTRGGRWRAGRRSGESFNAEGESNSRYAMSNIESRQRGVTRMFAPDVLSKKYFCWCWPNWPHASGQTWVLWIKWEYLLLSTSMYNPIVSSTWFDSKLRAHTESVGYSISPTALLIDRRRSRE